MNIKEQAEKIATSTIEEISAKIHANIEGMLELTNKHGKLSFEIKGTFDQVTIDYIVLKKLKLKAKAPEGIEDESETLKFDFRQQDLPFDSDNPAPESVPQLRIAKSCMPGGAK